MLQQKDYIIFNYPSTSSEKKGVNNPLKSTFTLGSYNKRLVHQILRYNGLVETDKGNFNLFWGSSPDSNTISLLSSFQKVNHFPYSKQIVGNKAELASIIQSCPLYSELPHFFPRSYILPLDRDELYFEMRENPKRQYIAKPPDGSLGNGIKIVDYDDFYTIHQNAVVSEYISRPLCIDSFKFDLRIYVLVTSFAPLRAFVYKEGLARFATKSYSNGETNVYATLTNATLNKHGDNWSSDFKWKLTDLLEELKLRFHVEPNVIMNKICHTVQMALAVVQHSIVPSKRYDISDPFFELFGFDLILDRDFNMSLLEINTFPSLGFDEIVDYEVKAPLIAQTLSIVGIPNMTFEELKEAEDEFRKYYTPKIAQDFEKFFVHYQNKLIKMEDERNLLSGNGFIRIFPLANEDPNADLLNSLMILPKYHLKQEDRLKRKKNILFHPKRLAKLLTQHQSQEILLDYLLNIQRELKNGDLSQRGITRLHAFLSAQGYSIDSATKSKILHYLKSFLAELKDNLNSSNENNIPEKTKEIVLNSGDIFLSNLLIHSNLGDIQEINTLFL